MTYQTLTPELIQQLSDIAPGRVFTGSDIKEDYAHDEMPIYGKKHSKARLSDGSEIYDLRTTTK